MIRSTKTFLYTVYKKRKSDMFHSLSSTTTKKSPKKFEEMLPNLKKVYQPLLGIVSMSISISIAVAHTFPNDNIMLMKKKG